MISHLAVSRKFEVPEAVLSKSARARVVVVGGGFGGLSAARELVRLDADYTLEITLLDRRNHHLFQPLLYQVATAVLNPSDVAAPLRTIFRRDANVRVLMAEARGIDLAQKCVLVDGPNGDGDVPFDFLIVATGTTHSYFGHENWAKYAPGLKTIEDALDIRGRLLLAFERAERETDDTRRREWLTFVIVGAGPTGVELAGALAEIAHKTLAREFRAIDPKQARIVLVEGMPNVLPAYGGELSASAAEQLGRLGVEVRTGAKVVGIDAAGVALDGVRIAARTVVWAAGVHASPLGKSLGAPLDRAERVRVEPTLAIPGHSNVFVVGDLAALEQDGAPVPGLAPVAMQEGRHAARNVWRASRGEALESFHYRHRGSFAVIGRGAAVGEVSRRWKARGVLAWWAWLLIHIFYLIGFRNRLSVLFGWAYSFLFTWRRGARLITEKGGQATYSQESASDSQQMKK